MVIVRWCFLTADVFFDDLRPEDRLCRPLHGKLLHRCQLIFQPENMFLYLKVLLFLIQFVCLSRLISTCLKESGSSRLLILCFIITIFQITTITITAIIMAIIMVINMAIIMIIIITCLKESGSSRPLRVRLKSGEEKEVATDRGRTHLEKDHHHHYCNNQNLLLVPAAGPFSIIYFFSWSGLAARFSTVNTLYDIGCAYGWVSLHKILKF